MNNVSPIEILSFEDCVNIIRPILFGEDCWYIDSKVQEREQLKHVRKWILDKDPQPYRLKKGYSTIIAFEIDRLIDMAYDDIAKNQDRNVAQYAYD